MERNDADYEHYRWVADANPETGEFEDRFVSTGGEHEIPREMLDRMVLHEAVEVSGTGQRIGLSVVEGDPDSTETVIVPMPYTDVTSREFTAYRLIAIAHHSGCRVIGFDMPGTGMSSAPTQEQKIAARGEGSFEPIANSVWKILAQDSLQPTHKAALQNPVDHLIDLTGQKYSIYGPSMAAMTAVDLATTAERHGIKIDTLITQDSPVAGLGGAGSLREAMRLGSAFLEEMTKRERYIENPRDETLTELDAYEAQKGISSLAYRLAARDRAFVSVYTQAIIRAANESRMVAPVSHALETQPGMRWINIYHELGGVSVNERHRSYAEQVVRLYPGRVASVELAQTDHSAMDGTGAMATMVGYVVGNKDNPAAVLGATHRLAEASEAAVA